MVVAFAVFVTVVAVVVDGVVASVGVVFVSVVDIVVVVVFVDCGVVLCVC